MKVFECKMCGTCCRGEGGITVNNNEIRKIASFMNMKTESFTKAYTYEKNGHVSIRAGKDGYCAFFNKEAKCTIQSVKPEICRLWPFFPANIKDRQSWEIAKLACPGINPESSFEEFIEESRK